MRESEAVPSVSPVPDLFAGSKFACWRYSTSILYSIRRIKLIGSQVNSHSGLVPIDRGLDPISGEFFRPGFRKTAARQWKEIISTLLENGEISWIESQMLQESIPVRSIDAFGVLSDLKTSCKDAEAGIRVSCSSKMKITKSDESPPGIMMELIKEVIILSLWSLKACKLWSRKLCGTF